MAHEKVKSGICSDAGAGCKLWRGEGNRQGGPDSADAGAFKGISTVAKVFHPFCSLNVLTTALYVKSMYAIKLAHPEQRVLKYQDFPEGLQFDYICMCTPFHQCINSKILSMQLKNLKLPQHGSWKCFKIDTLI